MVHSGGDLRLFPAQHHHPERAGCREPAADKLRPDQEGLLEVTVGPIPPDDGELRTEIGGVVKVFQNFANIAIQPNPSPIVLNVFDPEGFHQLDERPDSLVGDAMVVSSDAPPRPLFCIERWYEVLLHPMPLHPCL